MVGSVSCEWCWWLGCVAGEGVCDGVVAALDVVEADVEGEDVVEPVGHGSWGCGRFGVNGVCEGLVVGEDVDGDASGQEVAPMLECLVDAV